MPRLDRGLDLGRMPRRESLMKTTASILAIALLTAVSCYAAPVSQSIRVHQLVAQLHVQLPPDWNFILLNEGQWRGVGDRDTNTAFSHLSEHLTYVRESYAIHATDKELLRTLAHEIGHFQCQCQDENKANVYRNKILQKSAINLR